MAWHRMALVGAAILPALAPAAQPEKAAEYRSPYSVKYTHTLADLVGDLEPGPRGDRRDESTVPFRDWYSPAVRERWGAWGPPARHYPAPAGVAGRTAAWKRERVVAVAMRFRGYGYQHHHVPDWDPPAGWPWKETQVGHNGKGVDCSNLTAFAYNQALGVKPTGAIKAQAEQLDIPGPGGKNVRAEKIELPGSYAGLVKKLKTGDLLYVRGKAGGEVTHVVIWVGAVGQSPDGTPLVLDSHGQGVKDSNGAGIPVGIHLRPFRESSWYYKSASHAHRIVREE